MKKIKLIDPFAAPTVFVDGFGEHEIINGSLRTAPYKLERERGELVGIIQARMVISLADFREACLRGLEMTDLQTIAQMQEYAARH